ncbi:hypothetical protein CRG98_026475 [Punica granatum]|uniref:Retrotransposon Copia-like N-terminal domain-containing protein n=1 Tax=Punica granatum TaxID=22663 RepID=A0A2I0JAT0_PUNGR|nr:hypothetical protein CRG98_026475 [Punica granatum]
MKIISSEEFNHWYLCLYGIRALKSGNSRKPLFGPVQPIILPLSALNSPDQLPLFSERLPPSMENSADSLPSSLPTVPVTLNGRNFSFWKGIMSPLLDTYSLLDCVEGRVPAPSKTVTGADGNSAPNPDYRKWVSRDKFALTCLMLAVTEDIGCSILSASTSNEAWLLNSLKFTMRTDDRRIPVEKTRTKPTGKVKEKATDARMGEANSVYGFPSFHLGGEGGLPFGSGQYYDSRTFQSGQSTDPRAYQAHLSGNKLGST